MQANGAGLEAIKLHLIRFGRPFGEIESLVPPCLTERDLLMIFLQSRITSDGQLKKIIRSWNAASRQKILQARRFVPYIGHRLNSKALQPQRNARI
jgi:hypothetical protein